MLVACLVLMMAGSSYGQGVDRAGDAEAIRTLIQETQDANNAGDVERWVALFADDFVYMPPAVPAITTREALVDVAQAGFRHEADIAIEPIEVQVIDGWAFARTRVTGTIRVEGSGEVIPIDSKQLVVYRREGDGWKIARMISNRNTN